MPTTLATTTTQPTLPTPQPPPDPDAPDPGLELGTIEIPKLGVNRALWEGVSLTTLDRGPGHWPGHRDAGPLGNVVVGGHRVSHDRPFRHIDQLVPGDEIVLTVRGRPPLLHRHRFAGRDAQRRLGHQPDHGPHGHAVRLPPAGLDEGALHRLRQARGHLTPGRLVADLTRRSPAAGCRRPVGAGALVAFSLPPWGWWPLAFIGIAILDRLVAERPRALPLHPDVALRAWPGWPPAWAGCGSSPPPGYIVAVASYAGLPRPGGGDRPGRTLAAAGPPGGAHRGRGHPLRLALRWRAAGLARHQPGASPAEPDRPAGGVILITWLTFIAGSALAAAWERSWREAAVLAAVPVALIVLGAVAPSGHDTGRLADRRLRAGRRPAGHPRGGHRSAGGVRAPPGRDAPDRPNPSTSWSGRRTSSTSTGCPSPTSPERARGGGGGRTARRALRRRHHGGRR